MHSTPEEDLTIPFNWVTYVRRGVKLLIIFYIATFCLIMFILHRGENWILPGVLMIALYVFVIGAAVSQFVKKLPLPVLFLASPTIPLLMLICVLSMVPLLNVLT